MRLADRLLIAACTAALASNAEAQRLTGVVRDATLGQPVAGAVVSIVAADSTPPVRTVTDRTGTFRLEVVPGARVVQVRRIGFRPRDVPVADSARTGTVSIIITLERIPAVLEPVVSQAVACPRGRAVGEALAYWEQARLGLLATVVARDIEAVSHITTFRQRERDGKLVSQSIETRVANAGPPMFSERAPEEYAAFGYSRMTPNGRAFYGPDADVLLHDAFRGAHCFDMGLPEPYFHPGQVGIEFKPPPVSREDTLVEISGTLWLNRTPLALTELEFRYEAGDELWRKGKPGGSIVFRTVDNGIVVIEHWTLRVPTVTRTAMTVGSRYVPAFATFTVRPDSGVLIVGGELLSAKWQDGTSLSRRFPAVTGIVVDEKGQPSPGAAIAIENTPYRAIAGADGRFTIPDVLPGPYVISAVDSEWIDFGAGRSSSSRFMVPPTGPPSPLKVEIPSPALALSAQCRAMLKGDVTVGSSLMVGHVVDADGRPVSLPIQARSDASPYRGGVGIRTDERGAFSACGLFPGSATVIIGDSASRPFRQGFVVPRNGTLKVRVVLPRGFGGILTRPPRKP